MNFNSLLIEFFLNNWILLVILTIALFPIFPPGSVANPPKYYNTVTGEWLPTKKLTLLGVLIVYFVDSISYLTNIFISLMTILSLKTATTFIIFVVIGFDVFYRKQVSKEAITLTSIGVIALYLEQLIEKAKKIVLFWKILEWESKDSSIADSAPKPLSPSSTPILKSKSKSK